MPGLDPTLIHADQLQLQVHIVLSTGRPTVTQVASIIISTFSLTLASCRAFYVQRSQELADPEPNIHMILCVFPYMLIQVHESYTNRNMDVSSFLSLDIVSQSGAVSHLGVVTGQ